MYLVLPVASRFGSLLLGSSLLPADALLTAGILEWGYRSIFSPTLQFFQWTAGFPLSNTLAVTENLAGWQLFYSPLRTLGVGVAGAYSTIIFVSLVLSGLGAALFARRLGVDRWGAAVAGLIFALGPFHLANLMHIQTMAVCWMPFALVYLDRYLESEKGGDARMLGAFVVITALSSLYFAVFLPLTIVFYCFVSWITGHHRFGWRVAKGVALTLGLSLLSVSPLALPYLRFTAEHGAQRNAQEMADLSMEWTAPLRAPAFNMLWSHTRLVWQEAWNGQPGFIGLVATLLIVVALLQRNHADQRRRRIVIQLALLTLGGYLLALGPYFKTGLAGASHVIDWIPMPGRLWLIVPGIRWPARFYFIAWLGASVVAGIGLSSLLATARSARRTVLGAFVFLLVVAEYWPAPWLAVQSQHVSQPIAMSDAYQFLASEKSTGGVIEIPVPDSSAVGQNVRGMYVYGSSGHLRRITSIIGARKLPVMDSIERAGRLLPDPDAIEFLAEHGVNRIVVHISRGDTAFNRRLVSSLNANGYTALYTSRESIVFPMGPVNDLHQSDANGANPAPRSRD